MGFYHWHQPTAKLVLRALENYSLQAQQFSGVEMILLHRLEFGAGHLFFYKGHCRPWLRSLPKEGLRGMEGHSPLMLTGQSWLLVKWCSPDGQQDGSGSVSDSQICTLLGLILPRRKVVGIGHLCNVLPGEECHTSLQFGHILNISINCGHLIKSRRKQHGTEETETRLSRGLLWLCNIWLMLELAKTGTSVSLNTGFSCLHAPKDNI